MNRSSLIALVILGNVCMLTGIALAGLMGTLWIHRPDLPTWLAAGMPAFCAFAAGFGGWFAGCAWSDLATALPPAPRHEQPLIY